MRNQDWWKTIFDKDYMDIYSASLSDERTANEVDCIEEFLNITPRLKVIDIACGFGRHSVELAKRGYDVLGIDYSKYMIELADKTKSSARLENLIFETGDMRRFKSDSKFDVALLVFSSFGYFSDEENQATLENTRNLLKTDGKLLIDLRNYLDVERDAKENGEKVNESTYKVNKTHGDASETIILDTTKRQTITDIQSDSGSNLHFELVHYSKEQIVNMLESVGFSVVSIIGDYDMKQFSVESKRLIISAEAN